MSTNIVNIVNFVRGSHDFFNDSKEYAERNFEAISKEIELCKEFGFKHTVLLEYNAIIREHYKELILKNLDSNMEVGLWLEFDRMIVEAVGLEWGGKEDCEWDPYTRLPFTPAYTSGENHLLIDEYMRKFKVVFKTYPKSVGAWVLDSYSVEYMAEKYGIEAVCICREQWGIDGYTLWGGYFCGGYYPSRNNIIMPAGSKETMINVPVFRMLGEDPMYEYDNLSALYEKKNIKQSYTMEPWLHQGFGYGNNKPFHKWYFDNTCENESLAFSYVQLGQENSFGWQKIKESLRSQFELVCMVRDEACVDVMTLSETGKWFKDSFKESPACAVSVLSDWKNEGRKTVWYNSRRYRVNLLNEDGKIWFRDIHLFDDSYRDIYLDKPCEGGKCYQTALPVIDGSRWRTDEERVGLKLSEEGEIIHSGKDGDELIVTVRLRNNNEIKIRFSQNKIFLIGMGDVRLVLSLKSSIDLPIAGIREKEINYLYNGFVYILSIEKGTIKNNEIVPEKGEVIFRLGY